MSYQRGDRSSPLRKPKRAPSGTRHTKRRVSHGGIPPLPKAPPPRPADVRAAGAGPGPRPRACGKRTFFVLVFLRRSLVSTASICQAEGPGTSSRSSGHLCRVTRLSPGRPARLHRAACGAHGGSVPSPRVTFLSGLQRSVQSPVVLDSGSPSFEPPRLSVKGEQSTAEWCPVLPRPATRTSSLLPRRPSREPQDPPALGSPPPLRGAGPLTPSLDVAQTIYRVPPGYQANPTLPAGSAARATASHVRAPEASSHALAAF